MTGRAQGETPAPLCSFHDEAGSPRGTAFEGRDDFSLKRPQSFQ